MNFDFLLKLMVQKNASDLFITAGLPPSFRINGNIVFESIEPFSAE